MRIKIHKNKNEYFLTSTDLWVRNFTKKAVPFLDMNRMIPSPEYPIILENEIVNVRKRHPWIDSENFTFKKVAIVSDGYDFMQKHKILNELEDVCVIVVNRALTKWKNEKDPTFFLVNNPYPECMSYIVKTQVKCIASTRTYHEFLQQYLGLKYCYIPVADSSYKGTRTNETKYEIDDYRNPICAAIGAAYRFGVEKLLLMCCDDSFSGERQGAEKIGDLWQYPSQRVAHGLIDGNLYWLSKAGVSVGDCSSGAEYKYARYISQERIISFFEE